MEGTDSIAVTESVLEVESERIGAAGEGTEAILLYIYILFNFLKVPDSRGI